MMFCRMLVVMMVAAFFSYPSSAGPRIEDTVDVLSYKIDVTIESDRIHETVTINTTSKKPLKKLGLRLANTMKVISCQLNGADVPYDHGGWDLELDFSKAGSPKGEFSIAFQLEGRPYMEFSKEKGGFIRTNVCDEHAYIRSQYAWYPRREDDPAFYDTTLKVRKDWQVRTAGTLAETLEEGNWQTWPNS